MVVESHVKYKKESKQKNQYEVVLAQWMLAHINHYVFMI